MGWLRLVGSIRLKVSFADGLGSRYTHIWGFISYIYVLVCVSSYEFCSVLQCVVLVCVSSYEFFGIYIGFKGCGYGVATVSRIDKIKGLFCRMSSLLYGSFEKATYN